MGNRKTGFVGQPFLHPGNNRPGEIADCRAADRQATTAAVNTRIKISSLPSHGIGPQCSLERY
jgi:hypothetical protein